MPSPLHYRPPAQPASKRTVLRWVLALLFLGLPTAALVRYRLPLRIWFDHFQYRRMLLAHTLPAAQPALTLWPNGSPNTMLGGSPPQSTTWDQFRTSRLYSAKRPAAGTILLFLHARTSGPPTPGHDRLVALHVSTLSIGTDQITVRLSATAITPGTAFNIQFNGQDTTFQGGLPDAANAPHEATLLRLPWGAAFQLFPAQPDPDDNSRLTLDYLLQGKRYQAAITLDGPDTLTLHPAAPSR